MNDDPVLTPNKQGTGNPRTSGLAIAAFLLGLFSFGCSCITGVPAIFTGLAALSQIRKGRGAVTGKSLAMIGMLIGLGSTLLTVAAGAWVGYEARSLAIAQNNMKQVALALHNYHDTMARFPMPGVEFTSPAEGMPQTVSREQVSWRVRLLPYLDEDGMELYRQFNFNEPWDSPQNKALIPKMPHIYKTPGRSSAPGTTRVQAVVFPRDPNAFASVDQELLMTYGRATAFDPARHTVGGLIRTDFGGSRFAGFRDGTSNSIAVVEADDPVIWTKPDDWELHFDDPKRGLGQLRFGGFLAVFGDATVRLMPKEIDGESVIRLCVINDGNSVEFKRERP